MKCNNLQAFLHYITLLAFQWLGGSPWWHKIAKNVCPGARYQLCSSFNIIRQDHICMQMRCHTIITFQNTIKHIDTIKNIIRPINDKSIMNTQYNQASIISNFNIIFCAQGVPDVDNFAASKVLPIHLIFHSFNYFSSTKEDLISGAGGPFWKGSTRDACSLHGIWGLSCSACLHTWCQCLSSRLLNIISISISSPIISISISISNPIISISIPIMLIEIAVVVWFHGGGLASGLGGMYEPHFIMDYQVKVIWYMTMMMIYEPHFIMDYQVKPRNTKN